jgi:hypothetical protein
MALSVSGHSTCCAVMVVTASGGGWNEAPLCYRGLYLLEFHEPESGDNRGHRRQHEKHAFHHADRYRKFPSSTGTRHNREKRSQTARLDMRVTRVPADASAPCRNAGAAR